MTEQENCGQNLLDYEELRMTTVGELMDMREELDVAFAERLGKAPDSGFNIEIKSISPDRVNIWGGYESFDSNTGAVVGSMDYGARTPSEAFNYAMSKINSYHVLTKEDRIKALQDELDELTN